MDEVGEVALARQPVRHIVFAQDGFPPLYHLLLRCWIGLLGPDAARWFSVLCGMLLVAVVWRLGRLAGGTTTAWVAAALVAISPIHIWYSQEARANMLFYFLAVLTAWLFFRAIETNRPRDWLLYGLGAGAGMYSHYYFPHVIAGLLVAVLFERDSRRPIGRLTLVHGAIALAAIPWLMLLGPDLQLQSGYTPLSQPLDIKSLGYTLVTLLFGFSVGPSVRDLHTSRAGRTLLEAAPWGVAALAVCAAAVRSLWATPSTHRWALRLGVVLVLPIAACGVAATVLDLGYRVRYVAWGATILLLLIALAVAQGRRLTTTWAAAALLVVLSAVSLVNRNTEGRYMNEDAKGAAAYLAATLPASSRIFVTSGYMATPMRHYLGPAWTVRALPPAPAKGTPAQALGAIQGTVPAGEPFWLLYSRPWDDDPGGRVKEELQTRAGLARKREWAGMELYEGKGW
jgi:4-amino-4-deoxy-L-arabinose transferase-like glycosyltransferase